MRAASAFRRLGVTCASHIVHFRAQSWQAHRNATSPTRTQSIGNNLSEAMGTIAKYLGGDMFMNSIGLCVECLRFDESTLLIPRVSLRRLAFISPGKLQAFPIFVGAHITWSI